MKAAILALVLSSGMATAATVPNPADYTLTVHVAGSAATGCPQGYCQRIDVTIDGKKMTLQGPAKSGVLALGNYKARLSKEKSASSYDLYWEYQFLMPDNQVRTFGLIGLSE